MAEAFKNAYLNITNSQQTIYTNSSGGANPSEYNPSLSDYISIVPGIGDKGGNVIEGYVYSPKYSCPYYCKTDHIHFATDSLYQKRLNK